MKAITIKVTTFNHALSILLIIAIVNCSLKDCNHDNSFEAISAQSSRNQFSQNDFMGLSTNLDSQEKLQSFKSDVQMQEAGNIRQLSSTSPIKTLLASISATNTTAKSIYFSKDNLGYFQMTWNTTTNATVVEVGKINPTISGFIEKHTLNIAEIWKVKMKSLGDIGCSMLYSTAKLMYSFILFDGTQLSLIQNISAASLPLQLTPYKTMNLNNNSYLSPDCRLLSVNGNHYYIGTSMIRLNTPTGNYTNSSMVAVGDYFYFLTSDRILYKYNFVQNVLLHQYLLPYTGTYSFGFQFNAYDNRIIISCQQNISNITQVIIKSSTYIIIDTGSKFLLLDMFTMIANSTLKATSIIYSPQLTKICRKYFNPTNSTTIVMLKDIDYSQYQLNDISIIYQVDFYNLASKISYTSTTFNLGDNFLVIRNDNTTNLTSFYSGYQFIGLTINLIAETDPITYSMAINSYIKIASSYPSLLMYSAYYLAGSYSYSETIFGSYSGPTPTQRTLTANSPYFKLNVSPKDGYLISAQDYMSALTIEYDSNLDQTLITLTTFNPLSTSKVDQSSTTFNGEWAYIKSSKQLDCIAFYSFSTQTISFVQSVNNFLNIFSSIPLVTIANFPPELLLATNIPDLLIDISSNFYVGSSCNLFYWNTTYNVGTFTQVFIPPISSSITQQNLSDDLRYILSSTIYQYSPQYNLYMSAYTLNSQCDSPTYYSYNNRIVIVCKNAMTPAQVMLIFHALVDYNQGEIYLLNTYSIIVPSDNLIIRFSQKITKAFIQYPSSTTFNGVECSFIDFNFDTGAITPLQFTTKIFCDTSMLMTQQAFTNQNFYLGDYFVAIRNDVIGTTPLNYLEEAYQFSGYTVDLLSSTSIPNDALYSIFRIIIDQNDQQNLGYYTFIPNNQMGAGYDVFQTMFNANLPTIKVSPYFMVLNNSQSDNQFILSDIGVSTFQIIYNPVTQMSTFKLSIEDRTSMNNVKIYQTYLNGQWKTLLKTQPTFTCFLISNQNSYTFLKYQQGTFSIFKQIGLGDLPPQLSSLTDIQIRSKGKLGQGCSFFSIYSTIINLNLPVIANVTNYIPFSIYNFTNSMTYLIQNNAIYKYNSPSNNYIPIYKLRNAQQFQFNNYQNRFLNLYLDMSQVALSVSVILKIQAFVDNDGMIDLIDVFNFDIVDVVAAKFKTSPKLTKFYLEYIRANDLKPTIIFKNIVFDNYYAYDVNFIDQTRYTETIPNSNAIEKCTHLLSDDNFVVRNDTTSGGVGTFVEQGYTFVGNYLAHTGQRTLSGSQIGNAYRTVIDQSIPGILTVLNLQSKYNVVQGYNVFQNSFGPNLSPVSPIITPPTNQFYVELNNSRADYTFLSPLELMQTWEITFNPNTTKSTLTYTSVVDSSPSHFQNQTMELSGSWSTIVITNKTLTCALTYQSNLQSYYFFNISQISLTIAKIITTAQMSTIITTADPLSLSKSVTLGAYCDNIQIGQNIYPIGNFTLGTPVVPTYSGPDLRYIIKNGSLMRYIPDKKLYSSIMQLPTWDAYNISSHQNRIIIIGSNKSSLVLGGVTSYILRYGFYAMLDTGSATKMVDSFYANVNTKLQNIPIVISPYLTKIFYQYTLLNSVIPISVIKTIDYTNLYLFDIDLASVNGDFKSLASFNSPYFVLGDQYLVIRNDTPTNVAALSSNPLLVLAQIGYQFINTNIVILGSRILVTSQIGKARRIFIDQTSSNLMIYDYILKYRYVQGFYVHQYNFTTFNGSQPTPSILPSSILTELNQSTTSQLIISSSDMISMEIVATTITTKVTYTTLLRSNVTNTTSLTYDLKSAYQFINSSKKLTCSLFALNQSYIFLYYNTSSINAYGPINSFPVNLSSTNQYIINDDCSLIGINGSFYQINNSSILPITSTIPLANISLSDSYKFIFQDSNLYKLSQSVYTLAFSGLPSGSICKIQSYDITVAAICTSISILTNTTLNYQLDVTIFMWLDLASLTLFNNQTYTYITSSFNLFSKISPKLSKIFYSYLDANGTITAVIKNIDFQTSSITDIKFLDLSTFITTTSIWNNYYVNANFVLSDYFLAVRNDSISSVINRLFVQQAYYFNGTNSLVMIGQRVLAQGEMFNSQSIIIDQSITNQLSLLVYYPKYRLTQGYRVYDFRYGSNLNPTLSNISNTTNTTANATNSTTSNTTNIQTINGLPINSNIQILPLPTVNQSILTTFYFSTQQNKFISSTKMDNLIVSQSAGITQFTINYIDRNSPTNITTAKTSMNGTWSLIAQSIQTLSCMVIRDSPSTSFVFLAFSYEKGTFSIVKTISSSIVPSSFLTSMIVGQNCILLSSGNTIYNLTSLEIASPTSWNMMTQSNSLFYVIADYYLYGFDASSNSYTKLASIDPYQSYKKKNYQNQLIISGYNNTLSAGMYKITQRIWIMVDGNILDKFDINAINSPTPYVYTAISPQLTKIFYTYTNVDGSAAYGVKSVDYISNTLIDYTFNDISHFLETVTGITDWSKALFKIGEYYMVVRNDTSAASLNPYEEVYQFIGDKIILLRSRSLSTQQIGKCYRTVIDDYYLNQLIVVDYYPALVVGVLGGYTLNQFTYGNIASTIKIASHLIPPYINTTAPIFSQSSVSQDIFQWTYIYINILAQKSKLYFYTDTYGVSSNNVAVNTFTLSGMWKLVNENSQCKLLQNVTSSQYNMYQFNSTAGTLNYIGSLTNVINSLTSLPTSWMISDDCSRVLVSNSILIQIKNSTFSSIIYTKQWISIDSSLAYALNSQGIWKFDTILNNFTLFYTNSFQGLSSNVSIICSSSALILYSNTYFYSLAINGSNAILILNISIGNISNPKVSLSSSLSNIVIYGNNINSTSYSIICYYINFATRSYQNITVPTTYISDITKTLILIQNDWIYLRQLNSSTIQNGNLEIIYGIQQYVIPILSKTQNISDYDSNNWVRTILRQTFDGNVKALTQVLQPISSNLMILQLEVASVQSYEGSQPIDQVNTVVVNGSIQLCTPGCDDCSKGMCLSCMSGFLYDLDSLTCIGCGQNCNTCSYSNPNFCFSCASGSYLSNNACLSCDSSCLTCNVTATSCHQCLPGTFYNQTIQACQNCSRNCLSCNSTGSCLECAKGFAVFNSTCRGCSISCSDCVPSNIMACTSCANGLQLLNYQCVSCPKSCSLCKNGKCAVCISGYHPSSDDSGQCVPNCQLPCSTCKDRQPKVCTSCFSGSVISGKTCVIDLTCNKDSSCKNCGQGTGYTRVGTTCIKCGSIANCAQCSQINSQLCSLCFSGFYIKKNVCLACPNRCITCISPTLCTSCQSGYTLVNSTKQSQCLQCTSPCLTCQNFQTHCTSCISGYTMIGWKCQMNINVGFTITLSTDIVTALGVVDAIVKDILKLIGKSDDEIDAVTFTSFKPGSTIISGFGSVGSASATVAATSAMSSGLAGATVGGIPVTSSTVVTNGVDTTTETKDEKNLPLIIGLSVGIPLIIIITLLLIYFVKKSKMVRIDPQSFNMKDQQQYSQNKITLASKTQQIDSNISINERRLPNQEISFESSSYMRSKRLPAVKHNYTVRNINEEGSQIQSIIFDTIPVPCKPKDNFELQIKQQSEISSEDNNAISKSPPVVVSSLNVNSVLKINEEQIEQYETVYLQRTNRRKKPKQREVMMVQNMQDSNVELQKEQSQHEQVMLAIEYGSQIQDVIYEGQKEEEPKLETKESMPLLKSIFLHEMPIQNDPSVSDGISDLKIQERVDQN